MLKLICMVSPPMKGHSDLCNSMQLVPYCTLRLSLPPTPLLSPRVSFNPCLFHFALYQLFPHFHPHPHFSCCTFSLCTLLPYILSLSLVDFTLSLSLPRSVDYHIFHFYVYVIPFISLAIQSLFTLVRLVIHSLSLFSLILLA